MRGEGRRGKEDRLLNRLSPLFLLPLLYSFLVKSLALRNVNGKHTKKTPATQGSRLHDTFTDLHKFPCLVTNLLLGSLSSRGQYKQKRTQFYKSLSSSLAKSTIIAGYNLAILGLTSINSTIVFIGCVWFSIWLFQTQLCLRSDR